MGGQNKKPLGRKAYGSIPHLPESRLGPRDYSCHEGQSSICTVSARKHDEVIVTEKLDGSNVAVAKIDGQIVALGRAGYLAATSPFKQHHLFSEYVESKKSTYQKMLFEGETLHGEWLALAHGTIYENISDPFVIFDLKFKAKRLSHDHLTRRCNKFLQTQAPCIHRGGAISISDAVSLLQISGIYTTQDEREGVVYRVETNGSFNFMAKYVRQEKIDGKYLTTVENSSSDRDVWNWGPYS